MNALIVYAHPEPRSFNGAMRDVAVATLTAAGHDVTAVDLCAEGFAAAAGPADVTGRANTERFELGAEQLHAARNHLFAPELQRHIDLVLAADLLILQFPLWWHSLPAILKGWIDRVFAFGVTYDFGRTWDRGVMRGRRAMLSFTTSAPAATFLPDGRNGDMERILWPIHAGIFGVCGYDVLPPFIAHAVAFIGDAARRELLDRYAARLQQLPAESPLFFHPHGDYGEDRRLRPEVEPRTPGQYRQDPRRRPA